MNKLVKTSLLSVLGIFLLFVCLVFAEGGDIKTIQLVTTQVNSNTVTTSAINLNDYKPAGFFSIELKVSHTGTVSKVEYETSNSGIYFQEPTNASDIVTSVTSNSGPNVNGVVLASFSPVISQYIRLKISSTDTTTNDLWFTIQ